MRLTAQVKGLDKVLDKLDAIDGIHKTQAIRDGLAAGGVVAITEAQRVVPVATGDLRDSLHIGGYTNLTPRYRKIGAYGALSKPKGSGKGVMVFLGSTLPYAHLVERGTRKMAARPYLRRAVDTKQKDILSAVDDSVQQVIDEG